MGTNATAEASAEQETFADIEAGFSETAGVEPGKMFGSFGLKINGKVFALLVKDQLVLKLPAARVDELLSLPGAERFEPGHGKPLKEWISLDSESLHAWREYAQEAFSYVKR